jgi:hypothetical protein
MSALYIFESRALSRSAIQPERASVGAHVGQKLCYQSLRTKKGEADGQNYCQEKSYCSS